MASKTEYIRPNGGIGKYKTKVIQEGVATELIAVGHTSRLSVPENACDPKYFGLFRSRTTKTELSPLLNQRWLIFFVSQIISSKEELIFTPTDVVIVEYVLLTIGTRPWNCHQGIV